MEIELLFLRLLSEYPYRQITKDFSMRHDENYVE